MSGGELVALVMRTAVSLGAVLFVVAIVFSIARRRAGRAASPSRRRSTRRGGPPAIEVLGRAGLSRNASAVALRFGDRIVMVGVADEAPTALLCEVDAERWDELRSPPEGDGADETRVPTTVPAPVPFGQYGAESVEPSRPGFLQALRDATTRRP